MVLLLAGNEHDLRLFKQLMSGTDFCDEKGILCWKINSKSEKALSYSRDERPNKKATKKN